VLTLAGAIGALLGSLLVSIVGYLVQRWRYRNDRESAYADRFCEQINSAADLATEYWLLDSVVSADAGTRISLLEPQLVGRQVRIQSMYVAFQEFDPDINLTHVREDLVLLYDELTGGQFQVRDRRSDPGRAQRCQTAAARVNGEV
jgi:hypothetical protein